MCTNRGTKQNSKGEETKEKGECRRGMAKREGWRAKAPRSSKVSFHQKSGKGVNFRTAE